MIGKFNERRTTWLFAGMNAKDVEQAFKKRVKEGAGTNPSFKPPDFILRN